MAKKITIDEIPNEIHDNALDLIGNEFKFDHAKGMAEWLKNAVDAYRRNDVRQEEQFVVFRFTDQGVTNPIVECIDFMGMSGLDIEKALKIWFDPEAAKRGTSKKVYGGHGNGGKFYMRQMFKESRFITYKDGILNIFGFSEGKKYGYANGYKDKKMKPKEALQFAEIENLPIHEELKKKLLKNECGFTVVQGVGPEGVKSKFKMAREVDRFKNHPQSRRILERSNVSIVYNNHSWSALLRPDELEALEEFKEVRIITVPEELSVRSGSDLVKVRMSNEKYPSSKLILKTSSEVLARGSKLEELNRIDILGEIGVLASYQLTELGVTSFPDAAFVYGELVPAHDGEASILEDPKNDCVSNDRVHLVKNDTTRALLEWIAGEIDKFAGEITALKREKEKANQKEITSKFNDVLNEWKNKHMRKIMSDLFSGADGAGGSVGNGGKVGMEVSLPPNGFDFKYPQSEIEIDSPARTTLKISVPEVLPIGATIFVESSSENVTVENEKYFIKSDYLKATPNGQDVAFIDINLIGLEVGAEATITATAGKHKTSTRITVVDQKDKKGGQAFPRVLLSSYDQDPLGIIPGGLLFLGERDPVVYQRPQDVPANIYWINTSSPMASKIYDKFTSDSVQWRNFLFERYIDIFVKEAIHELERKDYENFNADAVDQKISEVVGRVHLSAKDDLESFLFDESYVVENNKE